MSVQSEHAVVLFYVKNRCFFFFFLSTSGLRVKVRFAIVKLKIKAHIVRGTPVQSVMYLLSLALNTKSNEAISGSLQHTTMEEKKKLLQSEDTKFQRF